MAEKGADASMDLQNGHFPGKEAIKNLLAFLKWSALALFAGIVIGLIGTAFHMALSGALALRQAHPWLVWLLPVGGVLITALYKWGGINNDRGTNFVLIAVRTNEKLSFKTAPLIFATTLLTHLFGGSAGREGAALQLGGSLAAKFGRILHLDEKDARILTMCGMSAAFPALFGTAGHLCDFFHGGHQRGRNVLFSNCALRDRCCGRRPNFFPFRDCPHGIFAYGCAGGLGARRGKGGAARRTVRRAEHLVLRVHASVGCAL